jgi:hypothetical protein
MRKVLISGAVGLIAIYAVGLSAFIYTRPMEAKADTPNLYVKNAFEDLVKRQDCTMMQVSTTDGPIWACLQISK